MEPRPGMEGAYALFADQHAHKCYDQVWRNGLYYALFYQGVRGQLWDSARAWLNSSQAYTTWNGTLGPKVSLEQGVRQGFVLSPILEYAFGNCFLLKASTKAVLSGHTEIYKSSLAIGQGAQVIGPTEAGVWSPALRCKLMTFLFMDDATLVSKTLPGLKKLIEAFCNFCHKFRSRLNPKKSKIMHFTRHGPDEEVQVQVGDHIFTTPEPDAKGRILHEYLGFLTDSKLNGAAHCERGINKARGMSKRLEVLAKCISEEVALVHLETNITPAVTYGMELVRTADSSQKLRGAFTDAVARASLTAKDAGWLGDLPVSSSKHMTWETSQIPWDVAQSAQLLRLASKLNTTEHNGEQGKGCLARALAKAKLDPEQVDWASVNTHLRQATKLSSQWGVPMAMPLTKGGNVSQKWKKGLAAKARKVAWEASVKLLVPRAPTLARGGDQADKCYVQGVNIDISKGESESSRWRQWVPNQKDRVGVRRIRLGLIEGLRSSAAVASREWRHLPAHAQEEKIQCPCGGGYQDSHHMTTSCPTTAPVRGLAAKALERAVEDWGSAEDVHKLRAWGHQQKAMHTLRSMEEFSPKAEARARATAAAIWRTGMEAASRRLKAESARSAAETTASVTGPGP